MQEHQPLSSTVEPAAAEPSVAAETNPFDDPRAMQILSTEHWSLLATRSLSWNESFSRAGLFLSIVSATAVALALVGQATSFGEQFVAFAQGDLSLQVEQHDVAGGSFLDLHAKALQKMRS